MTQFQEDPYKPDQKAQFIPSPKRVRAFFGGQSVVDSKRTMLLRDPGRLPLYYFPKEDIRVDLLVPSDHVTSLPSRGVASHWSVQVGDQIAEDSVWGYSEPPKKGPDLRGYLAFEWNAMDAWFEEDEEVFVHARDPYKRIDVLHSSRHVQVVVGGQVVADSHRPALLFETGLPTRYYLPKTDVLLEKLVPSNTHTACPYKGTASYYSVKVNDQFFDDIAWYYPFPLAEVYKIQNLICFFNERVEALIVDGEEQIKPKTPWSK